MTPTKIIAGLAVAGVTAGGGSVGIDQLVINPYTDVQIQQADGTTAAALQITKDGALPEEGIAATIVDTTQPKISLSKWNGEVNMGITYQGLAPNTTGSRPFLSKNVEWDDGTQKMEAVPLEASTTMEDGGMEINIILNSHPASNVFTFQLDNWQNLNFLYQPPLTDEEISEGFSQPDNAIGSYAVYYKKHTGHIEGQTNYATGKVYQIFRPLVTDAKGATMWADLSYSNGLLSVVVPQSFLDTAVFPVTVDPTFGYTSCGIQSATMKSFVESAKYTLVDANATVTKLSVCVLVDTAAHNSASAIYDSAGTTKITNANSSEISIPTSASGTFVDYTFAVNPTLASATTYWLSVNCANTSGTCSIKTDADASGVSAFLSSTYNATLPSSLAGQTTGTNHVSIYATYTAAASAASRTQVYINKATGFIDKATGYLQ